MSRIISRSGWDAKPPVRGPYLNTPITEVFLHHSVGAPGFDRDGDGDPGDDYMRQMQSFHMDTKGWSDIAYNHVLDPRTFNRFEGRGWPYKPGAQYKNNTGSYALCVMGDFRTHPVSLELTYAIAGHYAEGRRLGFLPDTVFVKGHRQSFPRTGTTCPGGNLMDAIPAINRLLAGDSIPIPEEPDMGLFPIRHKDGWTTGARPHKRGDVAVIQDGLGLDYGSQQGLYGDKTAADLAELLGRDEPVLELSGRDFLAAGGSLGGNLSGYAKDDHDHSASVTVKLK